MDIVNLISSQIVFFTNWIVLIVIFNNYTSKVFDLHFLTFSILIGGTYIFYIRPQYLPIRYKNIIYKIDGVKKHMKYVKYKFDHLHKLLFIYM